MDAIFGRSEAHATGIEHILVVCTGNICRSPFGEIALQAKLAGTGITVSSAGVYAMEGYGVDPGMVPELAARGLTPEGFTAHQITDDDVDEADLILVMSRRQRRFITEEWPFAAKKTLLVNAMPDLVEAARGGQALSPMAAALAEDEPVRRRGRRAAGPADSDRFTLTTAAVSAVARRRNSDVPEVEDPYRKDAGVFSRVAAEIDAATTVLADALIASQGHRG